MGTPYTPEYSAFRDQLQSLLDSCGVSARIIGKNEYPDGNPLHKIRDVMATCDGVLIVAYERKFVAQGEERRGGADGGRKIVGEKFTTPWNHVESAIAFATRLPIYIICQNGLTEEGLIESKIDWFVQKIDFTPEALSAPHVTQSIQSWINERVVPHSKKSKALLSAAAKLKLSEMTGEEWAAIFGIIGVAFGAGVAAASFFPHLFK